MKFPTLAIAAVATIATAVAVTGKTVDFRETHSYAAAQCRAVDGDTLRCGTERIRLLEIDAPEMPGHCRKGRVCAPGDPHAAKVSLVNFIAGQQVEIRVYATDLYGRSVADARVQGVSASCHQLTTGHAVRQLKWADYGVTTRECP